MHLLAMLSLVALTTIGTTWAGQAHPVPPPGSMRNAPMWGDRRTALQQALRHYPLSDLAMQAGVVALLNREEGDPDWSELDEDLKYEQYEQALIDLTKRIGVAYHNEAAWRALVRANYNPESEYGRWLINQPSAAKLIYEMVGDPNSFRQGQALQLLGLLLGVCRRQPDTASCPVVEPQRAHLISTAHPRSLGG